MNLEDLIINSRNSTLSKSSYYICWVCSFTFSSNSMVPSSTSRDSAHCQSYTCTVCIVTLDLTDTCHSLSCFTVRQPCHPSRTCLPYLLLFQNAKGSCTVQAPLFQLLNQTIHFPLRANSTLAISLIRKLLYNL